LPRATHTLIFAPIRAPANGRGRCVVDRDRRTRRRPARARPGARPVPAGWLTRSA